MCIVAEPSQPWECDNAVMRDGGGGWRRDGIMPFWSFLPLFMR